MKAVASEFHLHCPHTFSSSESLPEVLSPWTPILGPERGITHCWTVPVGLWQGELALGVSGQGRGLRWKGWLGGPWSCSQ